MDWIYFNDDNTNKGIEGKYKIENGKLILSLKPTNSTEDWLSDFLAIPWWDSNAGCFVHLGLRKYGIWTANFIKDILITNNITEVFAFGYSMGGGVLQISRRFIPIKIISIDGPRTTSKVSDDSLLFYNKGSLVHNLVFWFKKIKNKTCLNNKWQPFWKSHLDYNIDEIIERVLLD